jgi:7-cyano-7-deazaguanine synthase
MKALVIFSGGQDSTTALGWALKKYKEVEAITFFYGQKHDVELEQAQIICKTHKVKLHRVDLSFFRFQVDSALTSNGNVNRKHERLTDLPASFVPNRNALFLTVAHATAQKIDAKSIVIGVNQEDYSGYPDCRGDFIHAINIALNIGSSCNIEIKAPLLNLTKSEIFKLSENVDIYETVIELSHTCYNGNRSIRHMWGYGCGDCPACKLREAGYIEFLKTKNI